MTKDLEDLKQLDYIATSVEDRITANKSQIKKSPRSDYFFTNATLIIFNLSGSNNTFQLYYALPDGKTELVKEINTAGIHDINFSKFNEFQIIATCGAGSSFEYKIFFFFKNLVPAKINCSEFSLTESVTYGETISAYNLLYLKSDGLVYKAKADSYSTLPVQYMALTNGVLNDIKDVLVIGEITNSSWNFTTGAVLYCSEATAGLITETIPSTSGKMVQVVGIAETTTQIFFSPNLIQVEIGELISDSAFGGSWNGVTDVAPSKNVVYDMFYGHVHAGAILQHMGILCASAFDMIIAGDLDLMVNNDINDYIKISTTSDVPRIAFQGGNGEIQNVVDPTNAQDVATKNYVDNITHDDPLAIHDNISSEISAITEKITPISADLLLIEDSASSNAKKKVQIGNLPSSTGCSIATGTYTGDGTNNREITGLGFTPKAIFIDDTLTSGRIYTQFVNDQMTEWVSESMADGLLTTNAVRIIEDGFEVNNNHVLDYYNVNTEIYYYTALG